MRARCCMQRARAAVRCTSTAVPGTSSPSTAATTPLAGRPRVPYSALPARALLHHLLDAGPRTLGAGAYKITAVAEHKALRDIGNALADASQASSRELQQALHASFAPVNPDIVERPRAERPHFGAVLAALRTRTRHRWDRMRQRRARASWRRHHSPAPAADTSAAAALEAASHQQTAVIGTEEDIESNPLTEGTSARQLRHCRAALSPLLSRLAMKAGYRELPTAEVHALLSDEMAGAGAGFEATAAVTDYAALRVWVRGGRQVPTATLAARSRFSALGGENLGDAAGFAFYANPVTAWVRGSIHERFDRVASALAEQRQALRERIAGSFSSSSSTTTTSSSPLSSSSSSSLPPPPAAAAESDAETVVAGTAAAGQNKGEIVQVRPSAVAAAKGKGALAKAASLVQGSYRQSRGADGVCVYSRVLLAMVPHGDARLHLKLFKHIPRDMLESVLPSARVQLDRADRLLLAATVASGAALPLVRTLASASAYPELADAAAVGFVVLLGLRVYWSYWGKKTAHQLALLQNLYFKNLANNSAVLAMLLERGSEHQLKGALLAYYFLAAEGGRYECEAQLQHRVEAWLRTQFPPSALTAGVAKSCGGVDGAGGGDGNAVVAAAVAGDSDSWGEEFPLAPNERAAEAVLHFDAATALEQLGVLGLLVRPSESMSGKYFGVVPPLEAVEVLETQAATQQHSAEFRF